MILGYINDLVDIAQCLMFMIFICKIPNHIPSSSSRNRRERERESFFFLVLFSF